VHAPLLVAVLCIAVIGAGAVLWLFGDRRAGPYVAAIVPVITLATLVVLYAGNVLSHRWLGISFNYALARLWVQDWWSGQQFTALFSAGALAVMGGVAVLIVVLDLMIWARALRHMPRLLPAHRAAVVTLVVVTCGYAAPFASRSGRNGPGEWVAADPIVAFMRGERVDVDVRQQMIFDGLRQDEPLQRAAYGQHTFDRKNVIVITVDSLRPDHMQAYGYARPTTPFMSRLLAEGKLRKVHLATSTCAESNCGIVSTLFSRTLRHQVREDFSLYTLLKDQGYDTHFVLSGNHDWMGLREMYGTEMTSYFDGKNSARWGWSDDRLLLDGLDRIGKADRQSFFYFHLMSVHILGTKQARYRLFKPDIGKLNMQAMFRSDYDRTSVVNSYDNGVLQADDTIRQLFTALDRKGYLHNSIVVILADHGEALAERAPGMYGHINWLYQELITIPMLIYDESPVDYRGLDYGTQLDVAPTIVDRLGLPIPERWEGVSLLRETTPRLTMHQTRLSKPCFAVLDYAPAQIYKYMRCETSGREELYDLTQDPREEHDLMWKADEERLGKFRAALEDWRMR
jgi:glucan phosphoethanolaminetransferase (alkaline phosphatase superfamily)